LGPTIGGWITENYSWHWLFFINLLPGSFVAIAVPMLVRIDRPNLALLRGADYPGIVLMALFLGCLQYTFEEGPRWDWFGDDTIRATAWISAIAGLAFIWRSLTYAQPVVDLRALGDRNFSVGCFLSFVTGIGIFSTIYLTPLFLGYVRGFSAWQTGVAIFSTGAASLAGVPVYVALARKIDTRWLMMFGLASFAAAMWSFSFITHDWGADQLLIPQVLRGLPQVFAVAPAVNLGLGSLPPERLKYASGLFNMMRNLGGAVGIAVCGAILNNQTNLHFLYIASHLTAANGAMGQLLRTMTERRGTALGGPVAGHAGSVVAAVAPCLSRGLDPRLCRRLSRDHDCFRRRQSNGAADAQGGCARSAVIGRALTGPALKRFSESRRGGFEWKAGGIYAHTGIDRTGLVRR
jgi:DHA2 family multidrug resistance protein